MRLRRTKPRLIVLGFLVVTALMLALLTVFIRQRPAAPATSIVPPSAATPSPPITTSTPTPQPNMGLPVRLVIPRLKINANIEYVGVNAQGAMDVPADVIKAGWYKYGAHPGDSGSAVIAGHLNGVHAEPGVFKNLSKIRIGDSFSVLNDAGQNITFVVKKIKLYNQNEQPEEVFHSSEGAHVNLITCTGAWNRDQKQYAKRLVIFADKSS